MDFSLSNMLKQSVDDESIKGNGSLEDIFETIPVDLDTFLYEKRYLGTMSLSPLQYDVVKHIDKIYFPETYDLLAPIHPYWRSLKELPMKNTFTLQWAKSSGKGLSSRLAFLRVAYLLTCLRSPVTYYNSPENESMHLINVAPTSRQAREIFFVPMKRMIENTFFKDMAHPTNNEIRWPKGIVMISGNGEGDSQEGYNVFLSVTDEIDSFKSREEARAAGKKDPVNSLEKILDTLHSSGVSRYPSVYKEIRISYPRFVGSAIQRYTDNAKKLIASKSELGEMSNEFVSGPWATWDVNPVRYKEEFVEEYEKDPVEAAAKYECKPSLALNTYFRNDQAIDACFSEISEPVKVLGYDKVGNSWEPEYQFARNFVPIRGARYAMHGDLAINGDRAGIAMSHVVRLEEYMSSAETADGTMSPYRELRPIIKTDFVIAYEADLRGSDPREIQIRWARELAFQLIKMGFKIDLYTFDGYQSQDSIQLLNRAGIPSKRASTDLSEVPWRTLKDLIYEGRLIAPRNTLLIDELKSLSRLPGNKIDHPAHKSKDMIDALACSVMGSIELGGTEWDSKERSYYNTPDFDMGSIDELHLPLGFDSDMLYWGDKIPD